MKPAQKPLILKLSRLHCYFVEENEYDDVYLKYQGEKIWPLDKKQQPIKMDTTTELDIEITDISGNKQVEIELWDWDFFTSDDKLGKFTLNVESESGECSTDMELNAKETSKAKYTLDWQVIL